MVQPPSVILKEFFLSLQGSQPTDAMLQTMAEKMLLSVTEVSLWLEHLRAVDANRKQGAANAALTRKRKGESARTTLTQEDSRVINPTGARRSRILILHSATPICSHVHLLDIRYSPVVRMTTFPTWRAGTY